MARTRSIAALLLLGTALSACASTSGGPPPNRSLYSVNQPVGQRTDYVMDLGTSADGLPESERARLNAWFGSLELGYGDRISVDEAGGYGDGTVREAVAQVAGRYGLLVNEGAPVTAGAVQPGSVRVIVSRTTASVPNCPNMVESGLSATSPNYGCAINSNLAAMVADPNDLVLGQTGSGTGDPRATTRAIRTYRDAQPTGTRGLSETRAGGQ